MENSRGIEGNTVIESVEEKDMKLYQVIDNQMIPADFTGIFPQPGIYAIVGAGGKTTLCFAAAHFFQMCGYRTVVTTTTHMEKTPDFISDREPELVHDKLCCDRTVFTGGEPDMDKDPRKITSVSSSMLQSLTSWADYIFIEADGAGRLPLKVPAAWEPVIPPETDAVIAVAGLSGIGKPIGKICKRANLVCEMLGKEMDDPVSPQDVGVMLEKGYGTFRKTEKSEKAGKPEDKNIPVTFVLNQMDAWDGDVREIIDEMADEKKIFVGSVGEV